MSRNKVSEWSSTPSDNTVIGDIDINEGCPPATINNAIRMAMSQLKNQQSGLTTDNFTVGGNLAVTGTSTLTGIVTGPTATPGTNNTQLATTAFVNTKVGTPGTMNTQNANAVAITGGSITGLTALSTASGTISSATLTASTQLNLGGNWSVIQTGTDLIFKYAGVNTMKIAATGDLTVTGNITAYGTI
tara:strand:+ start:205 stop:771 length:567 start_codon:yes stop_codon:yes gene_type:complete